MLNTTNPLDQPTIITASKPRFPKVLIVFIVVSLLVGAVFIMFRSSRQVPPTTTQPTPTPITKVSLNCPVEGFCQTLKPVINNGNTVALSSTLPVNTPIRAIFDGETITRSVSAAGNPRETFYSVSLVDQTQQLKAVYYFKNKISVKESLKSGEVLASASAIPMKFFGNSNFAFSLLGQDNQIIPIEKIEFK